MFKELLEYLWQKKIWWLAPPIILAAVFGLLVAFSSASSVSPFVYMLF